MCVSRGGWHNANHIEDECSNNDEGDNDGYVSAGLREFTLSLSLYLCVCLGVGGIMLVILNMG